MEIFIANMTFSRVCDHICVNEMCLQYGDHLYVSDWQLQGIERFNKLTGRGRTIIRSKLEGIMDIRVVAEDIQTGKKHIELISKSQELFS